MKFLIVLLIVTSCSKNIEQTMKCEPIIYKFNGVQRVIINQPGKYYGIHGVIVRNILLKNNSCGIKAYDVYIDTLRVKNLTIIIEEDYLERDLI